MVGTAVAQLLRQLNQMVSGLLAEQGVEVSLSKALD